MWDFGAAPITPSTGLPFLNITMVGMLSIPNMAATTGFSSTFSFPNATFPAYWEASASSIGETILHGAHQGAQKSTTISGWL